MSGDCPIGSILMFGGAKDHLPSGWLYCDGTIVSQHEYQDLFGVVGHSFGDVAESPEYDPNKQFFLPDLRGRFVRGVDDRSARDPDLSLRTDMQSEKIPATGVGSCQRDQLGEHYHTYTRIKNESSGIVSGNHWSLGSDDTSKSGGKETRPLNVAMYFIIRANY
jgi:microcystin-dependent protein